MPGWTFKNISNPLTTPGGRRVVWWLIFTVLSLPWLWLIYNWGLLVGGELGYVPRGEHVLTVNPIEYTNRYLGDWALRFLLVALAVSPLARLLNLKQLIAFRRMIGVYAFAYVCLHLTSYTVLDKFFAFQEIWADIVKRNYITVGMAAFVLLIPLAVTSTRRMTKRLGARRWKRLHRLVYLIAPLAAFHYFMMAKGNQLQPKIYIGIVAGLLGIRVWLWAWDRAKKTKAAKKLSAAS